MKRYGMVEHRADDIWDTVCFIGADGNPFKPRDVISALVKYHGWNAKSAELYWNYFARYALNNPDEFSGPASRLEKCAGGYRLGDNPER